MDSLRVLITDSVQLLKIDTIDMLLRQKRLNTRRLLETWKETNTEHLYTINIEKVIAEQDTFIERAVFSAVWQTLSLPAVKIRVLSSIQPARS